MQRKLTTILSADVVGYSGLMEVDETGTLDRLKANRATIFDPQVATHGGRVFKLMGDGALVEFSSVVAAVNCALAIQEATENAEADHRDSEIIRYRIGINLGEVIIEGGDIYGDGVNVAARIQTLAPEGGVALSRAVKDQIEGKAPYTFEDMGEQTVRNIERPVHLFLVRTPHNEPERQKVEEPRRLSICVLPFANVSGDAEQEYFSDGISEDIIIDLSKISALLVISRNSSFTYKGKSVDVPKLARELRISYVLEGSVRKAGGRVRITAQLIDCATNGHVWAERYDRDLNDIFALQDEISKAIVKALKLKLLPEEKKAIERRGTKNVEAYNLYLRARQLYLAGQIGLPRDREAITRLCNSAIKIDSRYAQAWALLALAQATASEGSDRGLDSAERALELDASLAEGHVARGRVFYNNRNYTEAREEFDTALRLDPQSPEGNSHAGILHFVERRYDEAIRLLEKAASLSPASPMPIITLLYSYHAIGNRDAEQRTAKRLLARSEPLLQQEPDNTSVMSLITVSLATLGEAERANEMINRGMLLDPENKAMKFLFVRALALLGLFDAAVAIAEPMTRTSRKVLFEWMVDAADHTALANHPQFKALIASFEARVATEEAAATSPPV